MAIISSIGYGGDVLEGDLPIWRRSFAAEYGVVGPDDWKVAVKPGVDRTLTVAPGIGFGHTVIDENDEAEVTVTLNTLASGTTRWDMIVARRNRSGPGGTTTFTKVTGTSAGLATFASRLQDPSTTDDQPLALVQVNGNGAGGVINAATLIDLRAWAANGGMVATSDLVLQYLNAVGTQVQVGSVVWTRILDSASAPVWAKSRATIAPMSLFGAGSPLVSATAPVTDGSQVWLQQAGTQVTVTDGAGYARITFPVEFPNGLLTVLLTNGDSVTNAGQTFEALVGAPWPISKNNVVYRVWNNRSAGGSERPGGYLHRVNWLAIGW
jgi:hypothetical protein